MTPQQQYITWLQDEIDTATKMEELGRERKDQQQLDYWTTVNNTLRKAYQKAIQVL